MEELEALFVLDRCSGVVRGGAAEVCCVHVELGQANAAWSRVVDCCLHIEGLDKRLVPRSLSAIQPLCNLALDEDRQTLIEPEILPSATGHEIASPRVGYLMDGSRHLRLVSCYHGRRDEGEERVFHAAERKRWRQYQDVVLAPGIGTTNIGFNFIQIAFKTIELALGCFKLRRLSNDANTPAQRDALEITRCQSYKI